MDKTGDSEVLDCNANVTKLNIVKVLKMKSKETGEVSRVRGTQASRGARKQDGDSIFEKRKK